MFGVMARKVKLPPDTRLDWRDPDMPVLRTVLINHVRVPNQPIPPNKIQAFYNLKINKFDYPEPEWRNDPSYNWRKKRCL